MSSQEEKDKIAEQIIKKEKEKHTDRNAKICSIIVMIIIFIFVGIFGYNVWS